MEKKIEPESRLSESKPDSEGSDTEAQKPIEGSLVNVTSTEKVE